MLGIAVVGPGRAGRARLRALAEHPRARTVAEVGREGEPAFEAVLADPAVDAVIVCTPNLLHAGMARAALDAGKHVAVEFPLAASAAEARALLDRARARGRVLHAEHIELLSPAQRVQRARAAPLGRPVGGALRFTGGAGGWIGDPALAGSPALRALARLHRLLDLFGPARATAATLSDSGADGYRLEVALEFAAGGATRLVESRAPGLARRTEWAIECERGVLDDPPPAPPGDLFRQDLDWFLDRIGHGRGPYVSDDRVLAALERVGEIEALTARASGSRG